MYINNLSISELTMTEVKLFQYLSNFSGEEIKNFLKFINSGLNPTNRIYESIIKIFIKHKNRFKIMTKSESIDFVSSKSGVKKLSLHNRFSELSKLCEQFISFKQIRGNSTERNLLLLEYYSNTKSYKLFDGLLKITEAEIRNEPYEFRTFKYLSELYFRASNRYFFDNKFDKYFIYYKLRVNYSILHFISESLKSSFENYQQGILGVYKGNLLDEVFVKFDIEALLPEIKKTDPKGYNLIMIFFLIHQSVLDQSKTEYFLKCMELHSMHIGDFTRFENEQIFMISVTYCINQTNTGKEEFYRILFDLINEKIRKGYIDELKEDNIPVNNFRDYVIIALRLGKLDWIRNFVDDFSPMLPDRFREDERFIALGLLKLEEKKYEDAVKLFDKVKKTNYLHYIDSGANKTRAYYNLGYFDEAMEEIKKIRSYLSYKEGIPEIHMKKTNLHLKDIEQLLRYEFDKISETGLEHYFRRRKPSSIRRWVRIELEKMKIGIS